MAVCKLITAEDRLQEQTKEISLFLYEYRHEISSTSVINNRFAIYQRITAAINIRFVSLYAVW